MYFKIKENLYLAEQEIIKEEESSKETTNHILLYDRSGSMYSQLSKLTEDLILKLKEIPVGDTITIGWFSGEGQFNFILKGFNVTENEKNFKVLENAIRKNNTTVGCTCFSEILAETKTVLSDLSVFSDRYSLLLFTDGYPVVSNYSKEIKAIHKAIADLEGNVTTSCFIGYGNYYNKELMAEMAENLGGCLIHSSNLDQFNLVLTDFIKNTQGCDGKIEITLETPSTEGVVFSVNEKTINLYKQKEDNTVRYIPTKGTKVDKIYTLTNKVNLKLPQLTLTQNDLISPQEDKAPFIQAIYAVACLLNQKAKTDLAIDTLASIGEVGFIDMLTNSYTHKEHGLAEESLREALTDVKTRYTKGYNNKYLPDPKAFCLLDALELLMKDDNAAFYPYHPKFKYTGIGLASKTKGVYPKFQADSLTKCPFANLTWNESKLNLSVLAKINGTIGLIGDAGKFGFSQTYPTYVFRNYALVKDGFLNMDTLPVSLSLLTFHTLKSFGLIDSSDYKQDEIYNLNLRAIPVINRSISEGATSATDLSRKVFKELEYKAQLKVLNDYKKELTKKDGLVDDIFKGMTEEQIAFLQNNGITKNGFSPETEKVAPVDFYMVKEFDIKIKGFSTLPKVADVQTKIASGKTLRPVDVLMRTGLDILANSPVKDLDSNVVIAWLDGEIRKIKNKMLEIRFDVQKTKFAIILGKKWFNEFTSRENCDLVVDGNTFSFVLSETKVNI